MIRIAILALLLNSCIAWATCEPALLPRPNWPKVYEKLRLDQATSAYPEFYAEVLLRFEDFVDTQLQNLNPKRRQGVVQIINDPILGDSSTVGCQADYMMIRHGYRGRIGVLPVLTHEIEHLVSHHERPFGGSSVGRALTDGVREGFALKSINKSHELRSARAEYHLYHHLIRSEDEAKKFFRLILASDTYLETSDLNRLASFLTGVRVVRTGLGRDHWKLVMDPARSDLAPEEAASLLEQLPTILSPGALDILAALTPGLTPDQFALDHFHGDPYYADQFRREITGKVFCYSMICLPILAQILR